MTDKPKRGIVVLVQFVLAIAGMYLCYAYIAERAGWVWGAATLGAYVLIQAALAAA